MTTPHFLPTRDHVEALLQGSYNPDGIWAWWKRPRRRFQGLTPEEAWSQGRELEVLELAATAHS